MSNHFLRLMMVLVIVLISAACAPKRPVLYPNERLIEVGETVAQQDIDECMRLAAEAGLESKPGSGVVGQSAVGAAAGAAVGAAVGAVTGSVGRGAAAGAAGGGTGGLLRGLFGSRDPDPVQRQFVEECLREHGYKPIGWR